MKFRKEIQFPGAGTVVEETSRGTLLRTESRAPSEDFPAFARPFLGDELVIRQEEHWVSPDRAELDVTVPGKPGGMKGTLTLSPSEGGTMQTTEAEIKVNIPLIGGKVETLLGRVLGHLLKLQGRLGADWLNGKR